VGLGEVIFRLGPQPSLSRAQRDDQVQPVDKDFVTKYLKCLGLSPGEVDKVGELLKGLGISEDAARCIGELMKSASWDELFTKVNLEVALLEATSRHEIQRLAGSGGSASNEALALSAYYNFVLSIAIIRQLLNNEGARPTALATLTKVTYLLFDLLMETTKRKFIDPNLEVEIWRVRDVLVNVMEELFKGNGTITVHGKSFDVNRQLR
jgi:hypothetical protein